MQHERTFRPQRKRWPPQNARWPGCARLSRLLPAVAMLIIALCFLSCATTKKTQTEQIQEVSASEKSDTTSSEIRYIRTETVPESKVSLTISVDSLLKLPEGAVYRESKDRAHVEATHHGGVIYITGTCDSLQRQVEYYEALYHTARDALEQTEQSLRREKEKKSKPSWYILLLECSVGFIIGIATANIFPKRFIKG